jgi:hypothetical protein
MQNFARIRQIKATIESVNNSQEATSGALKSADENNDNVAVGIQVTGMMHAVEDLARTLQLFANTEHDFYWQELDELVDQVEWREKHQIPCLKT